MRGKAMKKNVSVKFRNIDSPFTELFFLLKRYEILPKGSLTLAYTRAEMKMMSLHIQNAMAVLFQGKQTISNFMGHFIQKEKCSTSELSVICFLMAIIDNLEEALYTLQLDIDSAAIN